MADLGWGIREAQSGTGKGAQRNERDNVYFFLEVYTVNTFANTPPEERGE